MRTFLLRSIPLQILALTLLLLPATAQVSDATLSGVVRDPSALVVAGAAIDLINVETAVQRSTRSNAEGLYQFANVPAGVYELRVSSPGFAAFTIRGLELEAGRKSTSNVALQIESSSATVTVTAAPAMVDTSSPTRQSVLSRAEIAYLPFTGSGTSGVLNLSLLSAGVSSSGGLGFGTGPSIGGQRPTSNSFLLEGVDINDRATTGPVLTISNEAVTELAIQKNQFSSEFGTSSAGHFNTILRTGSNDFHGSAYEYLQNGKFNAVDESFRRQQLSSNPRLAQNRYGMTAGGPLLPNRLFYFGNVERLSQDLAAASAGAAFAPTAAGFEQLASIPDVSSTNLTALRSAVKVPTAAAGTVAVAGRQIPIGLLNTTGPSYNNVVRAVGSIDLTVSGRSELRGRYALLRGDSIDPSTTLPEFYSPISSATDVVSIAHVFTFAPSVLNELRGGFMRTRESRSTDNRSFPGLESYPSIDILDLSLGIGAFVVYPQSNRSNTIQVSDTLSYNRGRHAFKFGYEGRRYQSTYLVAQYQRGYYSYNSLERYLMDISPEFGVRAVGSNPYNGNFFGDGAFAHDEWRLRPNLVVSAGLRYEWSTVPEGAARQSWNALASVPGVLDFRTPRSSKLDFAPRLGVAWSPGTRGTTSIRAGFGLNYDEPAQNMWMNSVPPQFYTLVQAQSEMPDARDFLKNGAIPGTPRVITDSASARSATSAYIPDEQRPYAMSWNAGIQRSVGRDYRIEVEYLGTRGVHLPMQIQLNRQAGATAGRSLPTWFTQPSPEQINAQSLTLADLRGVNTLAPYGFTRSITSYTARGNSVYHGLASSLARRYSNGLQLQAAYTWSHNIDDSTAVVSSTMMTPRRPQDFFDLRNERATSMLDRRHRLTLGWIYDTDRLGGSHKLLNVVLRHWKASGIWTSETGTPATVRSGIDSNMNGDNAADRSVINVNGDPKRSTTVTSVKNANGAVVGYLARDPQAMYVQAGMGVLSNGGRNTLLLPGIQNVDLSLARRVRVTERASLEFRAEAYNALNNSQFVPGFTNSVDLRPRVSPAATSMLLTGNALFNRPDLALESNSRTLQVLVRLKF